MNTLTNQDIARIFALYMPCKIVVNDKIKTITGITFQPIDFTTAIQINGGEHWGRFYDNQPITYKLRLTPLSKITDEHAIELANLFENAKWEFLHREPYNLVLSTNNFILIVTEDYLLFKDKESGELLPNMAIIEAFDRLRELGYDLPYKGQSLFELGIAIDKTTLNL